MKWFGNAACFILVQLLLVALQSSLWLQVFGEFPSPQFWIPGLVFWYLYRNAIENVFFVYVNVILLASSTILSMSLTLAILITIYTAVFYVKSRIYWSGPTFHMLCCGLSALVFPILHFGLSWALEPNPIHDPEIFYWIVSTLMTMLVALPAYKIFC
ncbi:MAG: hypothetical protein KDD22_08175, partial [Bdellovibrionales bacterium]|nr:hypothetical protein [Bdellovibrionales bacterium]